MASSIASRSIGRDPRQIDELNQDTSVAASRDFAESRMGRLQAT